MTFKIRPLIEKEVYYDIKDGLLRVFHNTEKEFLGSSEFPIKINSSDKTEEELLKISEKFDYSIDDAVFELIDKSALEDEKYNIVISDEIVTYYDYEKRDWVTVNREGIFSWLSDFLELEVVKEREKKEALKKEFLLTDENESEKENYAENDTSETVLGFIDSVENTLFEIEESNEDGDEEEYIDASPSEDFDYKENSLSDSIVLKDSAFTDTVEIVVSEDNSYDDVIIDIEDSSDKVLKSDTPMIVKDKEVPVIWEEMYKEFHQNETKEKNGVSLRELVTMATFVILDMGEDVFLIDKLDVVKMLYKTIPNIFDIQIVAYSAMYEVYKIQNDI